MTKKYTYFLGLNDKDTKTQLVRNADALHNVLSLVASQLWGGTVTESNGVFKHEDGTIVIENTIKIETLGFLTDGEVYENFARELAIEFNQESVLLEVSEVSESFLTQEYPL